MEEFVSQRETQRDLLASDEQWKGSVKASERLAAFRCKDRFLKIRPGWSIVHSWFEGLRPKLCTPGISLGEAQDNNPRRQPWDKARGWMSPGGAKDKV